MWQRTGNKYGAKLTEYNGITYHSRKEARYARELDLRRKGKDIKDWDRQIRCPLKVNGVLITTYVIDFLIYHNDGRKELVEIKGKETDTWRIKRKLLEQTWLLENKGYTYTVIK